MAARAPTGPTQYINKKKIAAGEKILSAPIDEAVEDQHFAFLRKELLVSDAFYKASNDAAWVEMARYWLNPDRCDAGTTSPIWWAARARILGASANFSIRLTEVNSAATSTIAVVASQTTLLWRGWGTLAIYDNGTENELLVEVQRTSGTTASNVQIVGFCAIGWQ